MNARIGGEGKEVDRLDRFLSIVDEGLLDDDVRDGTRDDGRYPCMLQGQERAIDAHRALRHIRLAAFVVVEGGVDRGQSDRRIQRNAVALTE